MGHKTDPRRYCRDSAGVVRRIVAGALGLPEGDDDRGLVAPGVRRNPAWERKSKAWLVGKRCEVCGAKENLECHHRYPYHLFPEREMDSRYWHALCRKPHDCHRLWGHFGDFKLFNPLLKELIAIWTFMVRMAKSLLKAAEKRS
jgi:hypothetical protein